MGKLYKPREVVEQNLLGIKARKLRQLITSWEIESINTSKGKKPNYLISEEAIAAYLEKNSTKAS